MVRLFKGGIHPYGKKKHTRKKELVLPESPPSQIILPLCTPCEDILNPVVQVGDLVNVGQIVAQPEEGNGVALYSGISGTVTSIALEPHPFLGKAPSIVIKNDFKNSQTQLYHYEDPEKLTQEQLSDMLRDRGVRGGSWEERPVYLSLEEYRGKVDTLIVNGVECEPYMTADHRLMLDRGEMVIRGSLILAQAIGVSYLVFAIQGDKVDAMEALEGSPLWDKSIMKVRAVPTLYPYGEEKQVIALVMKKELSRSASSVEADCAVFSVATAYAVGDAVLQGNPHTHRAVTVSGGAVKRPRNLWVPIGTPLESMIANGEGYKEDPEQLLLGGPMTGAVQQDLRAPILASSSGVLAMAQWEIPKHLQEESPPSPMPCIRCGHCLPVCPMHLMPNMVYSHMNKSYQNARILGKFQPNQCIGCGSCNYRCPSQLPLAQTMAKAELVVMEAEVQAREKELYQNQEITLFPPAPVVVAPVEEEVILLVEDNSSEKEDNSSEIEDGSSEIEDRSPVIEDNSSDNEEEHSSEDVILLVEEEASPDTAEKGDTP